MDNAEDSAAAQAAFDRWRRRQRPSNEVPATVVIDAVIGSNKNLVVFVSSIAVYSNGIGFTTELRGRGGPGSDELPFSLLEAAFGTTEPHHRMSLGVELPDGRRCVRTPRAQDVGETDGFLLLSVGGEGANSTASADWFLSPAPPPGELRLYCAWPSGGIPETETVVPADGLTEATRRVLEVWPPARIFDQQPTPCPVPLPSDGWFASVDEVSRPTGP